MHENVAVILSHQLPLGTEYLGTSTEGVRHVLQANLPEVCHACGRQVCFKLYVDVFTYFQLYIMEGGWASLTYHDSRQEESPGSATVYGGEYEASSRGINDAYVSGSYSTLRSTHGVVASNKSRSHHCPFRTHARTRPARLGVCQGGIWMHVGMLAYIEHHMTGCVDVWLDKDFAMARASAHHHSEMSYSPALRKTTADPSSPPPLLDVFLFSPVLPAAYRPPPYQSPPDPGEYFLRCKSRSYPPTEIGLARDIKPKSRNQPKEKIKYTHPAAAVRRFASFSS